MIKDVSLRLLYLILVAPQLAGVTRPCTVELVLATEPVEDLRRYGR